MDKYIKPKDDMNQNIFHKRDISRDDIIKKRTRNNSEIVKSSSISRNNNFFKDKETCKYDLNSEEEIENKKTKIRTNRKEISIFKNINLLTNYILIKIILKMILIPILSNSKYHITFYNFSSIKLVIKGIGNKNIFIHVKDFYFNDSNYPNEVIINGVKQQNINYSYYFNLSENNVELIWHDNIRDCEFMFMGRHFITHFDLSNFDTSLVTSMRSMFNSCKSLTSLNLSNFNTSLVENMLGMFKECTSLISLNLGNFDTSKVTNMYWMFCNSTKLSYLNLENFNTSKVEYMHNMFEGCKSLTSLNLDNFDTSKVKNMYRSFCECSSLISLNLYNFDTSQVTCMRSMFYGCSSLISLNVSNFNTTKVNWINHIFYKCSSLVSLDLSSFNTSKFTDTRSMFEGCLSLTSLNLPNFDTSKVTWINDIFRGCENLEYINLKNYDETKLIKYSNTFNGVPDNIVLCLNENYNINKLLSQIPHKNCYAVDCSDNWKSKQKKIINGTNTCIDNCKNNSLYEYNGKCYDNCPNNSFVYYNDSNKCKCELEECLICPPVALKYKLCTKCNIDYYPMENDPLNMGEYIKCYKELKGYYLDMNEKIYKKCYYTCETCDIKGDNYTHNCLQCKVNFSFGIIKNISTNYSNCYENSTNYYIIDKENTIYYENSTNLYIIDKENNYNYTMNLSNPDEYPLLIKNTTEHIRYNINDINKEILKIEKIYNNTEKNEIKFKNQTEEIFYYDTILDIIRKVFIDENYDTSNIDKGENEIIEEGKMKVIFTSVQNQKNKINNNITIIDLGECENLLRLFYNKTNNETLYFMIFEITQDEMKAKKIEYDVYCKLSEYNLEKLNLSVCRNSEVSISIPIIITESLDKLNISSGYYTDICYIATSDGGTDILLEDRKTEYINDNKMICQEECDFTGYNYTIQKAQCICKVKQSSSSFAEMKINKTKLINNLKDIKNIANINFLKCYKILLSKESILSNIGFYLLVINIIFHIISVFIFYTKQLSIIKGNIKDIIFAIENIELIEKEEKINDKKLKTRENINENNDNNNRKNKIIKNKKIKKKKKNKKKKKKRNSENNKIIFSNNNNFIFGMNENMNDNKNIKSIIYQDDSTRKIVNTKKKKSGIERAKKIIEYIDDEINKLSYDLALQYDKRTYCDYYISLLRTKHDFIFSFLYNRDYNSKIIKIDLFIISFAIHYTVNALFFNDDTMHRIYKSKGSFDLEYQLPIIIYSSLISIILKTLLKLLALSNDAIIDFKSNKNKDDIKERGQSLNEKLNIKFVAYFILSFIFLLFFWYYISMFGAIYRNTQLHLLKDTVISFVLSLLYPFIIYLLPGLFRIPALSESKKKRECLYQFSNLLQML